MACYLCIKNFLIKNSVTDALKSASERVIQNIASATSDLIGNKIEDYIYIYIYIHIALSEKYSKLLVFSDHCDNIIMDYQRIIY